MSWEIPYLTEVMDKMDDSKVVKNIRIKKSSCMGCTEPFEDFTLIHGRTPAYKTKSRLLDFQKVIDLAKVVLDY